MVDERAITVEATTSEDDDTLLLSSQKTVIEKVEASGHQLINKDTGVCDNQNKTKQSETCVNRPKDSIPRLGCFKDRKLYQRARFILDKVEKNEAVGKFDPRDAADKVKFQKTLEDLKAPRKTSGTLKPTTKRKRSKDEMLTASVKRSKFSDIASTSSSNVVVPKP